MYTYLDNSATTRVSQPVAEIAARMMTERFGNPSSLHKLGFEAEQALSAARKQIADVMGTDPSRISFTGSGSEANSISIAGAVRANKRKGTKIITTQIEHDSVINSFKQLETEGFEAVYIKPLPDGTVSPDEVAAHVDDNTLLVSVMHVNNETGAVNDIQKIVSLIKGKNPGVLFHTDCVQSFCKLPVTPEKWKADFVTVSAHKIHGPKGAGAIYRAKSARTLPMYYGSGQENGLHPGTENVPGFCAFGLAAQLYYDNRISNTQLFEKLNRKLRDLIADIPGIMVNSPENGAPYILNISIPSIGSEVMIHYLEQYDIFVSSGSACAKGNRSHVLTSMGLDHRRIDGALRVSFCDENTEQDIEKFVDVLKEGLSTLKGIK